MDQDLTGNGVSRCVKCGASDVNFDGAWLVCSFCRFRWNTALFSDGSGQGHETSGLVGTSVFEGAKDIDTSSLVTLECTGCGATVSINSEFALRASCHWCRHVLSLNDPVDNGAVPDAILPFSIGRDEAVQRMWRYVSERAEFASEPFKSDFATYPVHAVYLPYLVVDGSVTVRLDGLGWVDKGSYRSVDTTIYETDQWAVVREADLAVDDLAIEARSTRTRLYAAVSTTNIINAVQPFDVKNAMRFDANYISEGITFEKRDLEVSAAMSYAGDHFATIARGYVKQTLSEYTGGVRWDAEQTAIKGTRWVSVLLPVWLYAFTEHTPTGPMMHYIAVNGRTGDTEGSVPVHVERAAKASRGLGCGVSALAIPLLAFAVLAGIAGIAGISRGVDISSAVVVALFSLVIAGLIVGLGVIMAKGRHEAIIQDQRSPDARLKAEYETTYTPTRLTRSDHPLGPFPHRGGPVVEGWNDHNPHIRAKYSRVFLAAAPPPPPSDVSVAATASPIDAHGVPTVTAGGHQSGQTESPPTSALK